MTASYIYVIDRVPGKETGYKVGVTQSSDARWKGYRTSFPDGELRLFMPTNNAVIVERRIKERFNDYRIKNDNGNLSEVFVVDLAVLIRAVLDEIYLQDNREIVKIDNTPLQSVKETIKVEAAGATTSESNELAPITIQRPSPLDKINNTLMRNEMYERIITLVHMNRYDEIKTLVERMPSFTFIGESDAKTMISAAVTAKDERIIYYLAEQSFMKLHTAQWVVNCALADRMMIAKALMETYDVKNYKETLYDLAVEKNCPKVLSYLFILCPDVDAAKDGNAAAFYHSLSGNIDIVEVLLAHPMVKKTVKRQRLLINTPLPFHDRVIKLLGSNEGSQQPNIGYPIKRPISLPTNKKDRLSAWLGADKAIESEVMKDNLKYKLFKWYVGKHSCVIYSNAVKRFGYFDDAPLTISQDPTYTPTMKEIKDELYSQIYCLLNDIGLLER